MTILRSTYPQLTRQFKRPSDLMGPIGDHMLFSLRALAGTPFAALQVTSDQGWTAPIFTESGEWHVERTIKDWQPCADGTAADGHQLFRFYPVDDRGQVAIRGSRVLAGEDKTVSASGSCGSTARSSYPYP